MNVSLNDIIGSTGVFILLLAFVLNLVNKISKESLVYIIMNIAGGALAFFASYLLHYLPFVILEAVWTMVSIVALLKYVIKK